MHNDNDGNLILEKDGLGRDTTHEYDRQNRRISSKVNGIATTIWKYDPAGNVINITDPNNKATTQIFDAWNRVIEVKDPDGYTIKTAYDGKGNVVSVKDKNEYIRTTSRDNRGLALVETDAIQQPTIHDYDENGNRISTTSRVGLVTKTQYDNEDRPKIISQNGSGIVRSREVMERDGEGNVLQENDWNGNKTIYKYNGLNLVTKKTDYDDKYTETEYYKTGKIKKITNRRQKSTSYTYDGLGREKVITDAYNQTIVKAWDKANNLKSVKDKRGILTSYDYDDLNRLKTTSKNGLKILEQTFDDAGNILTKTDAEGNVTKYDNYNGRNLVGTTTYANETPDEGTVEITEYDGNGNVLVLRNENDQDTVYNVDEENRVTDVTFAGETTHTDYDAEGRPIKIQKPEGNFRENEYDAAGRLIKVTEGDLETSYSYDDNGNLLSQTLPGNVKTEFVYDGLNRRTSMLESDSYETTWTYDENGNIETVTNPNGKIITYGYDDLDRRTSELIPETPGLFLNLTSVSRKYDGNNNVLQITETKKGSTEKTETVVNVYDRFDRLENTTRNDLKISYSYDKNGNRTSVTYPGGGTTGYSYDKRNRLKTVTVGSSGITTWIYTPDGRPKTISNPDNTTTAYDYFDTNRVQYLTHTDKNGNVVSKLDYFYDRNGNRTYQKEAHALSGVSIETIYDYDGLDRLKSFTVQPEGGEKETTVYTYENHNRKTENVRRAGILVSGKTYNYNEGDNRLISVVETGQTPRRVEYTYDEAGNTLKKTDSSNPSAAMSFTYDAQNRLAQTKTGQTISGEYDYDADGLRVRHYMSDRGDVEYLYDGQSVLEERDGSSVTARYIYADRAFGIQTAAGGLQYYRLDAIGSTVGLSKAFDGSADVEYVLDPWGHIKDQTGESQNRQIFTGQEHDLSTGLIYFGARYYDPDTARFITEDPYLGDPGTPPSLHRYLYAYSNPTVYVDLNGYYGRDVHGYFVFFAMMSHGADEDTARAVAAYSQGPDSVKSLDAIEAGKTIKAQEWFAEPIVRVVDENYISEDKKEAIRVQRELHGLTGGNQSDFHKETYGALKKNTGGGAFMGLGYSLHAHGDSLSHVEIDDYDYASEYSGLGVINQFSNGKKMYDTGLGHAKHLTDPDKVSKRKGNFKKFVDEISGSITNFVGNNGCSQKAMTDEEKAEYKAFVDLIADIPDDKREAFIVYSMGGDPAIYEQRHVNDPNESDKYKRQQGRWDVSRKDISSDVKDFDERLKKSGLDRKQMLKGKTITIEDPSGNNTLYIPEGCQFDTEKEQEKWIKEQTGKDAGSARKK